MIIPFLTWGSMGSHVLSLFFWARFALSCKNRKNMKYNVGLTEHSSRWWSLHGGGGRLTQHVQVDGAQPEKGRKKKATIRVSFLMGCVGFVIREEADLLQFAVCLCLEKETRSQANDRFDRIWKHTQVKFLVFWFIFFVVWPQVDDRLLLLSLILLAAGDQAAAYKRV